MHTASRSLSHQVVPGSYWLPPGRPAELTRRPSHPPQISGIGTADRPAEARSGSTDRPNGAQRPDDCPVRGDNEQHQASALRMRNSCARSAEGQPDTHDPILARGAHSDRCETAELGALSAHVVALMGTLIRWWEVLTVWPRGQTPMG